MERSPIFLCDEPFDFAGHDANADLFVHDGFKLPLPRLAWPRLAMPCHARQGPVNPLPAVPAP
jgi:hypothetical protein